MHDSLTLLGLVTTFSSSLGTRPPCFNNRIKKNLGGTWLHYLSDTRSHVFLVLVLGGETTAGSHKRLGQQLKRLLDKFGIDSKINRNRDLYLVPTSRVTVSIAFRYSAPASGLCPIRPTPFSIDSSGRKILKMVKTEN